MYIYIYVKEMTINAAAEAAYSDHNSVTKALSYVAENEKSRR